MTKKTLQDWYNNNNNITYSEKERLNKIGVSNYDYHYLIDLQQILRCENWAKNNSEIRNKLDGRIRKIVFFTPNFNDSKPDASNYSCAMVIDGSNDDWVIVYRPSYVANIGDDLIIKRVSDSYEAERKLNGDYPITAVTEMFSDSLIPGLGNDDLYLQRELLPYNAINNPDKYILPLDIVKRDIHFGVYLGNGWVAHLTGKGVGEGTRFDTWYKFCNPSSSSNFFSSSSSSSSSSKAYPIRCHPIVPFKRKEKIIRHIAKAISHNYGRCFCHLYNPAINNCEHFAKRCVFGHNSSSQARNFSGPFTFQLEAISNISSLTQRIESDGRNLDSLNYNYSYEKGRIEQYIREAENNRSYTRSKDQIEEEKFEERIVVYPKDWCRVS